MKPKAKPKTLSGANHPMVEAKDLRTRLRLDSYEPTIRSSGIADLLTCYRKYMWRYRFALKPLGFASALYIGKVYHLIMAKLYSGRSPAEAVQEAVDAFDRFRQRLAKLVDKSTGLLPWGVPLDDVVAKATREFSKAQAMALWSWDVAPLDFDIWEPIAVEKLIDISVPGLKSRVRGRLDALLYNRRTDEVWLGDHKTTSFDTHELTATLRWNNQARLYRLLANAYCDQENLLAPSGATHDIIKKPTIRQKFKQKPNPETFDEYLDRVTQRYSEDLSDWEVTRPLNVGPPFVHSALRFPQEVISPEFAQTLKSADHASRTCVRLQAFPRCAQSCFKFSRTCPYHCLCSTPVADWPKIIETRFEVIPRDVDDLLSEESEDLL